MTLTGNDVVITLENENAELMNRIFDLEAENERRGKILNSYALQYGTVTDQSKKVKEIKSEAYKEFADKLTDRIADAMDRSHDNPNGSNYDLTDVFDTIRNLVKELTEGSNE